MKLLILSSLLIAGAFFANKPMTPVFSSKTAVARAYTTEGESKKVNLFSQSPESEKMLSVVFKAQDVCRAELKDFEFDVQFNVVSATVYFSGTNFKNVETGFINSNSLKPIRKFMDRCAPGTMIVFDNVKVLGPDKFVRTIQGTSYLLH